MPGAIWRTLPPTTRTCRCGAAPGARTGSRSAPLQIVRPVGLGLSPGRTPVFPSGSNVFDLELILGLQLPDRVGHGRLILFGVGKGQVRAINLDRTLALQKQAVELV